jgi:hypothetical protein
MPDEVKQTAEILADEGRATVRVRSARTERGLLLDLLKE